MIDIKIIERIKSGIKGTKRRSDPIAFWLNGSDARDILCPAGYTPISKNEEIRRCVHKIADLVSNMTIMLMQNGDNGDKRIKNELSKKLDIYPNSNMTRKAFIYKIVTDMCFGNSVVLPTFEGSLFSEFIPLERDSIAFRANKRSYLIDYKGQPYQPDEVLHFVFVPDDDEPFRGKGFTDLLVQTVSNLAQASATKTGFLRSKWKPSLIISINSDIEDLQDSEKRNKILGSYTKTTEIGEPWLIPAGELDIKTIQPLTLNDLAIQDSITLDIKTIAACFGIPAFMVGVGTFNKDEYNNFISTTIMSFAMVIQQELTRKLLYAPDLYFKFNSKSLMQYQLSEKGAFIDTMVKSGMLNRNEGRCEFDYSPVDDESMNEYNVLENYIPVNAIGKQKKLVQDGGDDNGTG